MILYFTGTGNSKFAAEYIADHIDDKCVSLNDIMKHKKPLVFESEKPFVIVAPIYAGAYPKIVMKLIRRTQFQGSTKIYFVATLGSKSCSCDKSLKELSADIGMECGGVFLATMPNNYIFGGNVPTAEDAEYIIKYTSIPALQSISKVIAGDDWFNYKSCNLLVYPVAGFVNKMFNKFMVSSDNFVVSGNCISCGKCAAVCPVNNIIMIGGEPLFRKKCLNCYSCISRCPKKAINIGKRTEKFNRYVCPEYKDWKENGLV